MIDKNVDLDQAARRLKALAHPTRLTILHLVSEFERPVRELEELLKVSQANLSQHLNLMKDKGLLASRRVGNQVYYRIKDYRLMGLMALIDDLLGEA